MDDKQSGVIVEQGFVAGDFGFEPFSESEKDNIEIDVVTSEEENK